MKNRSTDVGGMKNWFQYGLVALVIGGAFWTGTLYQQVQLIKKGTTTQVAGAGARAGSGAPTAPEVQPATNLADSDWAELLENPAATMGNENAKVTIVEFTDYECPFCKQAFDNAVAQIKTEYVDTGKVKYLIRDLPLAFHANAKPAALAARCSGAQGKYVEMHDALFENQSSWISGDPAEKFASYASDLGLNAATFNSCYENGDFEEEIDDDLALANRVGATGTPTFFVNGQMIVGAQPFSAFKTVIDEALLE